MEAPPLRCQRRFDLAAADRRPPDPGRARQLDDDLQRRRRQLAHRDRPVDPRAPRPSAHRSVLLHLGGQAVGADRMARRSGDRRAPIGSPATAASRRW